MICNKRSFSNAAGDATDNVAKAEEEVNLVMLMEVLMAVGVLKLWTSLSL
jgi:hypothetical protein